MKSRSVREEAVRLVLLLAGLCVAHLGVTLFLQTDLGSDPFNVFVQGLFRFLPWPGFMTHGRVHLLVSLVIRAHRHRGVHGIGRPHHRCLHRTARPPDPQ